MPRDAASPVQAVWLDRRSPPHLTTLVALAALAALNMNVFLPSLPGMARDLRADYALIQLAVSGYLGASAALQLVIGPLSDLYGRRPVVLAGLAIFLVATLGCVLAESVEAFLAWRLLGTAVAAGMVLSRAVVRDMVGAAQAASLIGYVTMGMSLAPMVGPMVGGWLDQAFGWRANFVLLAVLGAAVLALAAADLGETHRDRGGDFRAQMRAYPELARSRRFWGYAAAMAFASGSFFAFLGGAPYVATELLGMSAAQTGFWFGFIALGYAFGNYLSGRFAARRGVNRMVLTGGLVTLAGMLTACALFAAGLAHPAALFGPVLLVGVGNGLSLPSATAGSLSVRPHLAGSAAGLGGALMIGGGAALAAVTGALLGEGASAWPLLWMMTGSATAALGAVAYVFWVEKVHGPLPGLEDAGA